MIQLPPRPDDEDAVHPADLLIGVVAAFLTSLFLASGCTDAGMARQAALETVASYRVRDHADLLLVAQMVALAFAGLAATAMALAEGVPPPRADRLLGRAVSLNLAGQRLQRARDRIGADLKAAEQAAADRQLAAEARAAQARAQASLDAARKSAGAAPRPAAATEPPAAQPAVPAPKQAAPAAQPPVPAGPGPGDGAAVRADWAKRRSLGGVLNTVAERFLAELPGLPPAERKAHSLRAELASGVARDLLEGQPWDVAAGRADAART